MPPLNILGDTFGINFARRIESVHDEKVPLTSEILKSLCMQQVLQNHVDSEKRDYSAPQSIFSGVLYFITWLVSCFDIVDNMRYSDGMS